MTTDTFMTKRRARYKGEVGLFADNEMSEEDIRLISMDAQLIMTWSCPQTIEKQRFLWGVVYKTWQNTDLWMDHHEAMSDLKEAVHFTQLKLDRKEGKLKPRIKSMKRINDSELRLLTDRIIDYICQEILPGMKNNELRREVEDMFRDRAA